MATQVLLPLIASAMFLVGIWLAFVEIRNWWKAQTERNVKRSPIEVRADSIDKQSAANTGQSANNAACIFKSPAGGRGPVNPALLFRRISSFGLLRRDDHSNDLIVHSLTQV